MQRLTDCDISDSLNKNPTFIFKIPRYFTAYVESIYPYRFWVDGREQQLLDPSSSPALDIDIARGFFE